MTSHHVLSEVLEAFMPSVRMALLTVFCVVIGCANGDQSFEMPDGGSSYNFDALKARILDGPGALTTLDRLLYFAVLALAFEVFNYISIHLGEWIHAKHLPVRGHHLDVLTRKDKFYLLLNKISNGPFVLVAFMYVNWDPNFLWDPKEMTMMNVAAPFPIFFMVYDFFYTLGHMFLHQKGIYALIHKHHHRQQAPSRGSTDALNVHPLEYAFGQYNAIWTLFLMCRFMQIHIVGGNLIMFATNAASCFNHQRFDIKIPLFFGINLYESKCHDLHHRIPNVNFGQYIMLWDWIFGTHRPYSVHDKDPVDEQNQLDYKTGQTLAFVNSQKKRM